VFFRHGCGLVGLRYLDLDIQSASLVQQKAKLQGIFSEGTFPFAGRGPRLGYLRLDMSFFLWSAALLCRNLRALVLFNVRFTFELTLFDFYTLFNAASRLKRLDHRYIQCTGFNNFRLLRSCLPQTTHLNFSPMDRSSIQVLSTLDVPALQNMTLDISGESFLSPVVDQLRGLLENLTMA
jgi:hypothetical protein